MVVEKNVCLTERFFDDRYICIPACPVKCAAIFHQGEENYRPPPLKVRDLRLEPEHNLTSFEYLTVYEELSDSR